MNGQALLILSGNLNAWFYQTLAGVNPDAAQPGFKHILVKLRPLGDLTSVHAHHDGPYGRIVSNWQRDGDKLTTDVWHWADTQVGYAAATFWHARPARPATAAPQPGKRPKA